MNRAPHLLFIDHLDSFSENLRAEFSARGCCSEVMISRPFSESTAAQAELFKSSRFDALILSPGPGTPEHYPLTHSVLDAWPRLRPIFAVCLGHQILLARDGASLSLVSETPVHGRRESVEHLDDAHWCPELRCGGVSTFYNSWAVQQNYFLQSGSDWRLIARNGEFAAACEHKFNPWFSLQYHPESFATQGGSAVLDAFVALLGRCKLA